MWLIQINRVDGKQPTKITILLVAILGAGAHNLSLNGHDPFRGKIVGPPKPNSRPAGERWDDRRDRFCGLVDRALRFTWLPVFVSHCAGGRLPAPPGACCRLRCLRRAE